VLWKKNKKRGEKKNFVGQLKIKLFCFFCCGLCAEKMQMCFNCGWDSFLYVLIFYLDFIFLFVVLIFTRLFILLNKKRIKFHLIVKIFYRIKIYLELIIFFVTISCSEILTFKKYIPLQY